MYSIHLMRSKFKQTFNQFLIIYISKYFILIQLGVDKTLMSFLSIFEG
jgi:hypothetical protein